MLRLHSIDYLRGLMALSILFYHLISWTIGIPQSDTLLGKLGVYGVSTFYIVSGMAMYVSYKNTAWTGQSIKSFFIRRFSRLAPVYWLAMALVVIYFSLASETYNISWKVIVANATLTFSVLAPDKYMVTGGWSIGNEFAFYLAFPFLMVASRHKYAFLTMVLIAFFIYSYFCFFAMNTESNLSQQWGVYVNPLNQIFLFSGGMLIAWVSQAAPSQNKNNIFIMGLVFFSLLFAFYPVAGNQINIVTGWNRLLFTAIILGLSYCVYNVQVKCQNVVERGMKFMGDISYPVYLLHGVAFLFFDKYIWPLLNSDSLTAKAVFFLFVFSPFIFIASHFVYKLIEMPIITMSKNKTSMVKMDAGMTS